ncbi:hypothetical protein QR680_000614 [Steinernema hermaphroditum]|uniref:glucuronosyltransferase n=1 Tax=Steinernema hermaphroditum TaxID=289476 RepID=A0AA39GV87_9BILA|nr:hypothetical protein QR680_000614 [Steinernema hermaphroditum]
MSSYVWLLLTVLFLFVDHTDPYKILVASPTLSHSHIHFQGSIADVLVEAGHEVHIFMPDYAPNEKTNGSTKAHRITKYKATTATKFADMPFKSDVFTNNIGFAFDFTGWDYFMNTSVQYCHDMANDEQLMSSMRAEHYDVAMAEGYTYCQFGIFHALGIRTKIVTLAISLTENLADVWGIPSPKSYVVNSLNGIPDAPKMTFYERLINMCAYASSTYYGFRRIARAENKILKARFGSDFPDLEDIIKNVSLAFINSMDFIDISRPTSRKIVYIGGLNIAQTKQHLSSDIQKVFQSARNGVVLFSFGGIVDTRYMSDELKTAFLQAFARFPDYNFIWKSNLSDAQTIMERYPNVHLVQWMDQTTILDHPKTRAFITHCGLNSLTESIHSAVPLLGIPLFGDQRYNAAIIKHRELGIHLSLEEVTEETVYDSLGRLLHTDKYRNNAIRFKKMLAKWPRNPKEEVKMWVKFAAQFPDLTMMNLYGSELDTITYHNLDVIVVVVTAVFFTLLTIIKTCIKIICAPTDFVVFKLSDLATFQKIYGGGPSMKAYKQKVDYRLGYCLILCLTTIATILCIYGLFFLSGYQEVTKYVNGTIDFLENVESLSTTTETASSTTDMGNETGLMETTVTTTQTTTTTTVDPNLLTIPELAAMYDRLNSSYITVWNLCALNVIVLILLIPFTCYFHQRAPTNKTAKLVYRVALFIALLFMLAQLIFLISPLFVSAYRFPDIVDRLFVTGKPQDPLLLANLEDSYACNFDFHEVLVQYRLQEPCIPKIKNSLFPAYTVIMLIVIDLIPFAFLAYTYAWDACIKDVGVVREARYRVEVNNQRRTTTASAAANHQGPRDAQLV